MFPYIEVSKMFSVVVLSSFLVGVEGKQQQQQRMPGRLWVCSAAAV